MNNKDFEYEMRKVAWLRHVIRELDADRTTVQAAVEAEFGRRDVTEYKGKTADGRLQARPQEVYEPTKVFADFDPYELANRGLLAIPKGKFEQTSGLERKELERYLTVHENGSTVLYVVAKPAIAKADMDSVRKTIGNYAKVE